MRTSGIADQYKLEEAQQLLEAGLIEEYTKFAEKQAPGWKTAHTVLACLAVGHTIRDKVIPYGGNPRIFTLLVAPTRTGKTFSTTLAMRSLLPPDWILNLATATPEGLIEILNNAETVPVLVIDELGKSLATEYSRLDHFILRAYNDEEWWHIVRDKNKRRRVPRERMRVSIVGMSTPKTLIYTSPRQPLFMHAISGLLSRFIVISGQLTKKPKYLEPDTTFRVAIEIIANTPLKNRFTIDNNAAEEILNTADSLVAKYGDLEIAGNAVRGIHEHMAKLAACHAASRLEDHIEIEDAEFAIETIQHNIGISLGILEDAAEIADIRTARTRKLALKLIAILNEHGEPLNARYIYRRLRISAQELKNDVLPLAQSLDEKIVEFYDGPKHIICGMHGTDICRSCRYHDVCARIVRREP